MPEKAFVLGGKNGIHHYLRDVVEMNDQPLLALLIEQIRDGLRLQEKLRTVRMITEGNDLCDTAPLNRDHRSVLMVSIRTRSDLNAVRPDAVPPGAVPIRFGITATAQIGGDI